MDKKRTIGEISVDGWSHDARAWVYGSCFVEWPCKDVALKHLG